MDSAQNASLLVLFLTVFSSLIYHRLSILLAIWITLHYLFLFRLIHAWDMVLLDAEFLSATILTYNILTYNILTWIAFVIFASGKSSWCKMISLPVETCACEVFSWLNRPVHTHLNSSRDLSIVSILRLCFQLLLKSILSLSLLVASCLLVGRYNVVWGGIDNIRQYHCFCVFSKIADETTIFPLVYPWIFRRNKHNSQIFRLYQLVPITTDASFSARNNVKLRQKR